MSNTGLMLLAVAVFLYTIPKIPEAMVHMASGFLMLSLVAQIAVLGLLLFIVGGVAYIMFDSRFDALTESEGF